MHLLLLIRRDLFSGIGHKLTQTKLVISILSIFLILRKTILLAKGRRDMFEEVDRPG